MYVVEAEDKKQARLIFQKACREGTEENFFEYTSVRDVTPKTLVQQVKEQVLGK